MFLQAQGLLHVMGNFPPSPVIARGFPLEKSGFCYMCTEACTLPLLYNIMNMCTGGVAWGAPSHTCGQVQQLKRGYCREGGILSFDL